jgi:hypothetical protein
MSTFRRVVTGHCNRGRSIIASDQKVTGVAVPGMPGIELTTLWDSDHTMRYPDDGSTPKSPLGSVLSAVFACSRRVEHLQDQFLFTPSW